MDCDAFVIESPIFIVNNDLANIRKLYLPIIGVNSLVIYEYFNDLSKENRIFSIVEICNHLQITSITFNLSIENLEGVGLLTTYKKKDSSTMIFNLNKPLDIEGFNKNPLLKSHLVRIIGKTEFDKWYFDQKQKFINKSSYINVSKKYQDVFPDEFNQSINQDDETYTTMDLVVKTYDNHEDNIKKLHSSHFIKYLLKRNSNYYENQLINSLLNLGFSDAAINLLLDFSINFNNIISCPYISTIAQDFKKRSIVSYDDVKHELMLVANYKNAKISNNNKNKSIVFGYVNSNNKLDNNHSEKDFDINEIFDDEGMFD